MLNKTQSFEIIMKKKGVVILLILIVLIGVSGYFIIPRIIDNDIGDVFFDPGTRYEWDRLDYMDVIFENESDIYTVNGAWSTTNSCPWAMAHRGSPRRTAPDAEAYFTPIRRVCPMRFDILPRLDYHTADISGQQRARKLRRVGDEKDIPPAHSYTGAGRHPSGLQTEPSAHRGSHNHANGNPNRDPNSHSDLDPRAHRYADTDRDPHSPRHGLWWSQVGWFLSSSHDETDTIRISDFARYPELVWLDRHHLVPPVALGALVWIVGGSSALFTGFFLSTVLLYHGTFAVNSSGHIWGRRRFDTDDDSRNSWLLALITLGEGWHNNHHHYRSSTRQGFYWWEVDVSYYVLKVMSWLGLARALREPSERALLRNRIDAPTPPSARLTREDA